MYYQSPSLPDLILRTRWYVTMRWLYVFILVLSGALADYLGTGWSSAVVCDIVIGLLAMLANAVLYYVSRSLKTVSAYRILAIVMIVIDVVLITYLVYTKGGVASRTPILYTLPILMSAVILGRRAIYFAALSSIIAYDAIAFGGYLNLFRPFDVSTYPMRSSLPYVLGAVVFFSSVFIVIGLTVDFILRQLLEKDRQVSESLRNLNRAQTIAHMGSWTWNMRTNSVIWSKAMYDLFNIAEDRAITADEFFSRVYPADKRRVRAAMRKAIKKSDSLGFDYRIVTSDDTIRYIHSDVEVMSDQYRHTVMLGTSRDVTEERLLEQAKNEFVALASHQLRTPTTVVKQYLSMLLDGYAGQLTPAQEKYVKTANDNNERQITTINDLLNVAQIDSGKMKLHPETFDLVELLKAVVIEQSVRVADKHQTITLRTRHKKLACYADKHRLRMALDNIIDNAHKYSPDNAPIELQLTRRDGQIMIAIKDRGIGIDKANIPKIFQKFSRIDNPAGLTEEGTGLGLYWVQKVIQLHGGKITAESKLHRGTKFIISLPYRKSHTKHLAA